MYSISQKQGATVMLQTTDVRTTYMSNFRCLNAPPPTHTQFYLQIFGWAAGWIIRSSTPSRVKRCFSSSDRPDSGAHPASCSVGVGCEVGHSLLASAGIKMSGAVPLQPLCAFILWTGTALSVPLCGDNACLFQFPHSVVVNVTFISCL